MTPRRRGIYFLIEAGARREIALEATASECREHGDWAAIPIFQEQGSVVLIDNAFMGRRFPMP